MDKNWRLTFWPSVYIHRWIHSSASDSCHHFYVLSFIVLGGAIENSVVVIVLIVVVICDAGA